MSETPERDAAQEDVIPLAAETPPPSAAGSGATPAATGPAEPKGRIDRPSLLNVEGDSCPSCGAALQPGDLICMRCGYDLKANVKRTVETGVEHERDEPEEFVKPGRGSPRLWAIVGGVLTVAAMILAGINAPHTKAGNWAVVGAVFLTVYDIIVHTGTGLVAVAIAARIVEQRFGSLEVAIARVFAAYALFEMTWNIRLPLSWATKSASIVLAAVAYYAAIWVLFRKGRSVTLLIVLTHIVLWTVFMLGISLAAWVRSAQAAG